MSVFSDWSLFFFFGFSKTPKNEEWSKSTRKKSLFQKNISRIRNENQPFISTKFTDWSGRLSRLAFYKPPTSRVKSTIGPCKGRFGAGKDGPFSHLKISPGRPFKPLERFIHESMRANPKVGSCAS